MSARQYRPIYMTGASKQLIVYPAKDEVPLQDIAKRDELIEHVNQVYETYNALNHGRYHIIFAWNKNGNLMLDIWLHTENPHSDSGPLLEYMAFENGKPYAAQDIASGDTVLALAGEEQKRRQAASLDEYLSNQAVAVFPGSLTPTEEFA